MHFELCFFAFDNLHVKIRLSVVAAGRELQNYSLLDSERSNGVLGSIFWTCPILVDFGPSRLPNLIPDGLIDFHA